MIKEVDELRTGLLALPLRLRASLAKDLIESLDEDRGSRADKGWGAVIDRRSQEIEDHKVTCRPVTEVVREIRRKLKASRRKPSGS